MHILMTNDDGIHAPGLITLARVFSEAGHRVSVCAPDRERSAASHSGTFNRALHAQRIDFPCADRAWQADGTPADCARLGLYLTRDDPVDLVVSGINHGMNMGGACIYSGTVGAAMEASMNGTPALATSLCTVDWEWKDDYTTAALLTERVARWTVEHPLPRGAIYSLNVPLLPYDEIKGLRPAKLAPVFLSSPEYTPGTDEQGDCYEFKTGEQPPFDGPDYDVLLVDQGYAVITKLTWDIRLNAPDGDMAEIGI